LGEWRASANDFKRLLLRVKRRVLVMVPKRAFAYQRRAAAKSGTRWFGLNPEPGGSVYR
jgi:hypothetical protein